MTYPFGIDISSYQANAERTKLMDWQKAKDAGVQFAFVKSTEGVNWLDPTLAYNLAELERLSIPHGVYHYFRPNAGLKQIEFWLDKVGTDRFLVLDVEDAGGLNKLSLTSLVTNAVELVKLRTGRYPLIYSRATWLDANLDVSKLPKLDYWLAQYLTARWYPLFTPEYPTDKLVYPWGVRPEQVKFHQSGEKGNGKLYGAQSYYIDTDRFLGTQLELEAYFGLTEPLPEPTPDPTPIELPYKAQVTASVLIVRDAPAGQDTKERLTQNSVIEVIEEEGDWACIKRWVSKKYIKPVIEPPVPPPAQGTLQVEPFSQNDPRWKNNKLGTSSTTIGWNGCLITCCAMVERFYGFDYNPATLNTYLTNHNGYANGNLLWWGRVPHLQIAAWIDCLKVSAPLSQIDAALARGEPVIVHVDFVPSTNPIDEHYVLLIGKLGEDDYTMVDSWDGWVGSFKARYVNPSRYIYRIVSYRKA